MAGARSSIASKPGNSAPTMPAQDGNSARRDFLTYALSLMRAHNNEHYDGLPATDITSLKHAAYVLDALVYYMRNGSDGENNVKDSMSVQSWFENEENADETGFDDYANRSMTMETDSTDGVSDVVEAKSCKKNPFFQRSESTIFFGCTPPDPFQSPLCESLPLAEQPHLLHPYSRKEDLFGMPRQTVNPNNFPTDCSQSNSWLFFNQLPTHLALSRRCPSSSSLNSVPLYQPLSSVVGPTLPVPNSQQPSLFQGSAAAPPAHSSLSISPAVDVPSFGSSVIVSFDSFHFGQNPAFAIVIYFAI